MFQGSDINIPICGNTQIGKVCTHSIRTADCEDCIATIELLEACESYEEACTIISDKQISDNLEEHGVSGSIVEHVLGSRDTFWKNMEKFRP